MALEGDTSQLLKLGLTSEDARALMSSRPNVVFVGLSHTTEAILRALTPHLRPPVQSLQGSGSFPSLPQGTLILRELETLDSQAQLRLLRWLDGFGVDMQVISLTSSPLYPRVEEGTFLEALYYRLNILHLEPFKES
jgi:hypothetical protein